MKKNLKKIAVFIFVKERKVLVEKRIKDEISILEGELMFPGGGLEDKDLDDIETALKREINEELGVIPTKFFPLKENWEILGTNKDVLLTPFIIESWENEIPEKILDEDDSLFWVDLDIMLSSKIEPTRKIAKLVKKYLEKNV